MALWTLGQPGWAGIRRNIYPLTPIVVINHPLSASSICYKIWHPPWSIYMPDSHFAQFLSKFSLVYLLAWHPPHHAPYISSHNQCLLFAAHDRTIATCSAVVLRLCHLVLVSVTPSVLWRCWLRSRKGVAELLVTTDGCVVKEASRHWYWHQQNVEFGYEYATMCKCSIF